ncbi:MAG TPA: SHOCT domain-containing protein, partial [Candidatus Acidoferrales bacterium]|nr:SHOCT domain-containing protein [Candidatus Acidoferrales bacterium]
FAQSKGKVAVPISTHEVPLAIGRFASFEYQFRLVSPDSPAAKGAVLVPRPDVIVEKNEKTSIDVHTTDTGQKAPDVYSELLKLDDLRRRGIITDAEFEAQKQKILRGQ